MLRALAPGLHVLERPFRFMGVVVERGGRDVLRRACASLPGRASGRDEEGR